MRDVAVVIPTTGARLAHLRAQLYALRRQVDAPDFDIIAVDNRGSSPGLRRLVADYATAGMSITLVPGVGVRNRAYAANHGAASAVGATHLLFLDDDDVVSDGYIAAMHTALIDHPYVGARMDVDRLNAEPWVSRRGLVQHQDLPTHAGHRFVVGAATGIRRDWFMKVGGYDISLATQEDVDLGIRLQRLGVTPRLATGAVLHYRYRDSWRRTWMQERAYGKGEVGLAQKHQLGRRPVRAVAGSVYAILRGLAGAMRPRGRAVLCTHLAAQVGRVRGSVRHRMLYP